MVIVFSLNGDNYFRDPSASNYASVDLVAISWSQSVPAHCRSLHIDSRVIVSAEKDYHKIVKRFKIVEFIDFPSCSTSHLASVDAIGSWTYDT
jgi:hypothetical protein